MRSSGRHGDYRMDEPADLCDDFTRWRVDGIIRCMVISLLRACFCFFLFFFSFSLGVVLFSLGSLWEFPFWNDWKRKHFVYCCSQIDFHCGKKYQIECCLYSEPWFFSKNKSLHNSGSYTARGRYWRQSTIATSGGVMVLILEGKFRQSCKIFWDYLVDDVRSNIV